MVGRPGFPKDVDARPDLKGSAVGTPGLTALDEEREASLADEGGASGAHVETQDEVSREEMKEALPVGHLVACDDAEEGACPPALLWTLGAALAVGILGLLVLRGR